MQQYTVTGMSCAACSARVEKAVSKVPGVTSCSVSLLTNSMGVEGTASSENIIAAVEEAGYGASEKGAASEKQTSAGDDVLADHETPALIKRLVSSLDVYKRQVLRRNTGEILYNILQIERLYDTV